MVRQRRSLLLALALALAIVALVSTLTQPVQQTAGAAPAAAVPSFVQAPVQASIPTGRRRPVTVSASVGQLVDLSVATSQADSVAIPALGLYTPADPSTPASFSLVPSTPGHFAIRLLSSGRLLGSRRPPEHGLIRRQPPAGPSPTSRAAWASWSAMKRPLPSHHGQRTSWGSPPSPETTLPLPRQARHPPESTPGAPSSADAGACACSLG